MQYRFVLWLLATLLLAGLGRPSRAAASGPVTLMPTWATGVIAEEAGVTNIVVTDLNHDGNNDSVSCSQGLIRYNLAARQFLMSRLQNSKHLDSSPVSLSTLALSC